MHAHDLSKFVIRPEQTVRDAMCVITDNWREFALVVEADLRVIGPVGSPVGFHLLKADELYQFYVAAAARGQGVAQELIADAETCLAAQGHAIAWLACAIGNGRAARFYEKCGWRRSGNFVSRLETADGPFDLEVWRYERRVGAA